MCYGQYMDMSNLLPDLRPPHVQVLAPNFPQIDSDIDAREYSFDDGENSTDFKGFHRLERLLFRCAALPSMSAGVRRNVWQDAGFTSCAIVCASCSHHTKPLPLYQGVSSGVCSVYCRDNALGPATLAYAQELEELVEALNATLYNTSAFAVGPNFEGIIGVATEIVAKKVCGFPSCVHCSGQMQWCICWAHTAAAGCCLPDLDVRRAGRSITDNLLCLPH